MGVYVRVCTYGAQLAILFNNFGLLTAYLIIIADILVGPGGGGADGSGTGVLPMLFPDVNAFRSRAIVLAFVSVFGILPNALRKRMDGLKVQSMISMVLATAFIVLTVVLAVIKVRVSPRRVYPSQNARGGVEECML